jgi:hypothetical protein
MCQQFSDKEIAPDEVNLEWIGFIPYSKTAPWFEILKEGKGR